MNRVQLKFIFIFLILSLPLIIRAKEKPLFKIKSFFLHNKILGCTRRPTVLARTNAQVPTSPIDIYGSDISILDTNSLVITQQPFNGTLKKNVNILANGSMFQDRQYIYTPRNGFSGIDTFTYTVQALAPATGCFKGTVEITVLPKCFDDNASTIVGIPVAINVLQNDIGSWDTSAMALVSLPANGNIQFQYSGSGKKTGYFIYTPTNNNPGSDNFTYRACDNTSPSACDQAVVYIKVKPFLLPDSSSTFAGGSTPPIPVLGNDLGLLLPNSVQVIKAPLYGQTIVNPIDGSIIYKANKNYSGSDIFTYQACNNAGLCGDTTVSIKIFPISNLDTLITKSQTTGIKNISLNDYGLLNTQDITIITPPLNGIGNFIGNGTISYLPNKGFTGYDSLKYKICALNNAKICDTSLLYIIVGPKANPDTGISLVNTPDTVKELINDWGHLDTNSVKIISPPSQGTTKILPGGQIYYLPSKGYTGTDQLVYQVCDTNAKLPCDQTTITFRIGIPDADLNINKTAQLNSQGYLANYTISIGNAGPNPGYLVEMNDKIPSGSNYVPNSISIKGSGTVFFNDTTQSIVWKNNSLGKDSSVVIQYQLSFSHSGLFTNTANLTEKSFDPNMNNNTASAELDITLPPIKIPNVFTPNGDGHNDYLVINGLDAYPDNSIQIFNRWGNCIYQRNGYNKESGWDGSGLSEGTYFIVLKINESGKMLTLSRYLTLIRIK